MGQNNVADKIIRFSVGENDLETCLYEHIAKQDYIPDDMLSEIEILGHLFFYFPVHKYKIKYNATWTASFGFDREEHYIEYINVTKYPTNGPSYTVKEPVNKTRTITDWRPASGYDNGSFTIAAYAGDELSKSPLRRRLFDLMSITAINKSAITFQDNYLNNFENEEFCIKASKLINTLDGNIDEKIYHNIKKHAQGNHQKNWHSNHDVTYSSESIYIPICCTVFKYNGEEFNAWTDGVECSMVITDELPHDNDKVLIKNIGFIPMVIAMATVVYTTIKWEFVWFGIGAIGATWIYALIRNYIIREQSKNIRESVLEQIKENLNTKHENNNSKIISQPEKSIFTKLYLDFILICILSIFVLYKISTTSYEEHKKVLASQLEDSVSDSKTEQEKQPKKHKPKKEQPKKQEIEQKQEDNIKVLEEQEQQKIEESITLEKEQNAPVEEKSFEDKWYDPDAKPI